MSKSALASKLGIGRRTIRYWIASGQLDRELDDDVVRCKKLWSAKKKIAYRWIDFLRSTAEDDLGAVHVSKNTNELKTQRLLGDSRMRIVVLGVVLALALPTLRSAQVDYESMRRVREMIREMAVGGTSGLPTWRDHQVHDDFTRETRQYVQGWGEREVLFMVATCDAGSILLANRGLVLALLHRSG